MCRTPPNPVALEATLYWAWRYDRLTAAGCAAVAVHRYQVKLIWQARCKTDPIDARSLAELGRVRLRTGIKNRRSAGCRWICSLRSMTRSRSGFIDLISECGAP